MTKTTHTAIGVASTLLVVQPTTINELGLSIGVPLIAAILPDIDVKKSSAHQKIVPIVIIAVITIAMMILGQYFGMINILEQLKSDTQSFKMAIGFVMFITACLIGLLLPYTHCKKILIGHRSFTHSILGSAMFILSVYLMMPTITKYFAAAYISHILIDFLNRKKCNLFWPSKKGFCLNICYSDKIGNKITLVCGIITSIVLILMRLNVILV